MEHDGRTRFALERAVRDLADATSADELFALLLSHVRSYDETAGAALFFPHGTAGDCGFTEEFVRSRPGFGTAAAGTFASEDTERGTIAFAPLRAQGAVHGVLAVALRERTENSRDADTLCALGAHAALVLRSFEKTAEAADMARLARVDALTHLPNRRAFEERLEMEWQRAGRSGTHLAVISIDVDFFGAYNERYGHPAGDACLQRVASALSAEIRRPEDLLARYGGEEFIALLPGCGLSEGIEQAERMMYGLRNAGLRHEATSLGLLTGSFGVAVSRPSEGQSLQALLAAADAALYAAKERGRNRVSAPGYDPVAPVNARLYSAPHNIPHYITEFFGRERDLRTVEEKLNESRLVTVVGAGGIGKTRIACKTSLDRASRYADGVLYLDLSVCDDVRVPVSTYLAQALAVREDAKTSLSQALTEMLRTQRRLIVLDNCETAIEETAKVVDRIIRACPHVHFLATSREPLALSGEALVQVDALEGVDAVALFVNRARLAHPDAELLDEAAVRTVCDRLDRLPFAIELAAAQPFDSVQTYAATAPQTSAWRKRSALPRQESIYSLIEWSYCRLDAGEQAAFRALSVLCGPFGLDDASAVCDLSPSETDAVLRSLQRKSLLSTQPDGRRRMLELTAEYGRSRLASAGEAAAVQARHAARYASVAALVNQAFLEGRFEAGERCVRDAGANLSLALDGLIDTSDTANEAAQMAGNLALYWEYSGSQREGRTWLERVLTRRDALRPASLAQVDYGIAVLASTQGDKEALIEHASRALRFYHENGDDIGAAHASRILSIGNMMDEDFESAEKLLLSSIATFERIGYHRGVAGAVMNLGVIAMDWRQDFAAAERHFERSLEIYKRQSSGFLVAIALMNLGELAFHRQDYTVAVSREREAIMILRSLGHPFVAIALGLLGRALTAQGLLEPAFEALRESLRAYRDFSSPKFFAASTHYLAEWLWQARRPEDAARTIGFLNAYRERQRIDIPSANLPSFLDVCESVSGELGDAQFARYNVEGANAGEDLIYALAS